MLHTTVKNCRFFSSSIYINFEGPYKVEAIQLEISILKAGLPEPSNLMRFD